MNKALSQFLDRLAERLAALAAGILSSRVQSLSAAAQADQQSQLEDLARQYEADGKTAIAATLRQRANQLTSCDLAADAVEMIRSVGSEPIALPDPAANTASGQRLNLPDFAAAPTSPAKKKRKKSGSAHTAPSTGDQS